MSGPVERRPDTCWQIPDDEIVDWRQWGDEFVVRSASRAQTHLLSAAAGNVLLSLLEGRRSLSLEPLFIHAFGDVDDATTNAAISPGERESLLAIVAELERLGLVTPSA